jgi:hypothetical protein
VSAALVTLVLSLSPAWADEPQQLTLFLVDDLANAATFDPIEALPHIAETMGMSSRSAPTGA